MNSENSPIFPFWVNFQAMRILILTALACQTAAFLFSIFGLKCTSIGLQRPDLKYRLVRWRIYSLFWLLNFQNIVSLVFHIFSLVSITIGTVIFTNALINNSAGSQANQVTAIKSPGVNQSPKLVTLYIRHSLRTEWCKNASQFFRVQICTELLRLAKNFL